MFGTIAKLDKQTFQYIFALSEQREWLLLARKISKTGDGPFYFIFSLTLLVSHARGGELFSLALAAFILYLILKNAIRRTRPCHRGVVYLEAMPVNVEQGDSLLPVTIVHSSKQFEPSDKFFSLPSGHTAAVLGSGSVVTVIFLFGY